MELTGKILITGGTGSLGTALVERATKEQWPVELTVLSRDENKQSTMKSRFPQARYILGDIRDESWMRIVLRGMDTVLHLAAYKQIPSAQNNVSETIKTNIMGSMSIARAAVEMNVKQVATTSTDKAAAPANCYGASKSVMESLFQQANSWGDTKFTITRYGNVAGSRGSVIPFFLRLAKQGKTLTVTHPEMTRFWITLHEATDLVLKALDAPAGSIVVPKAPAMRMVDLAYLIAGKFDVDISTTGIRPGEKIHEMMVTPPESFHASDEGEHFLIYPPAYGKHGNLPEGFTYSSDKPSHWLSDEEMWAIIEEWELQYA